MTDYKQIIKDLILRISYEVSDDCGCLLHKAVEEETDTRPK